MQPTLEIFSSQVVVVGNFNPPVMNPGWLGSTHLVGDEDVASALESESLAITPEISRFETAWFSLQVLKNQMVLASKGPVTPALQDLLVGIFSLLPHTPVTAIGLNSLAHFKVATTSDYHKVGDVLAPKPIWNRFFPESKSQNVGLEDLTMVINACERNVAVPDDARVRRISLSASDKIRANGIKFMFNDHFPIMVGKKDIQTSAEKLVGIVEVHWQASMDEAKTAFSGILAAAISE